MPSSRAITLLPMGDAQKQGNRVAGMRKTKGEH
jgi:hypothetical protein